MSQRLEYKGITFDDFTDDRDDFRKPKYWSQICEICYKKYDYKMQHISDGAGGICGVEGCKNEANYYIDFDATDVRITDIPFIRTITKSVAEEIIEFREPLGLFLLQEDDSYIGIDNTTGNAWCEEFTTREACLRWLTGDEAEHETSTASLKSVLSEERINDSLSETKEKALRALSSLRANKIPILLDDYTLICDAITGIETVDERDNMLETLWEQFGDLRMNPTTERMEQEFLHFPVGTHREEIWHWFDKRHSKGVAYLLYGETAQTETVISTPIGAITVHKKDDDYPGFWINLHRPKFNEDLTLALVEYSISEGELATRVWGKSWQEDYTAKITHEGIEDFFRKEN